MQQLAPLVKSISDFFWNNILLFLLFGTGIWFTVRMRFIQVRRFGHGLALSGLVVKISRENWEEEDEKSAEEQFVPVQSAGME